MGKDQATSNAAASQASQASQASPADPPAPPQAQDLEKLAPPPAARPMPRGFYRQDDAGARDDEKLAALGRHAGAQMACAELIADIDELEDLEPGSAEWQEMGARIDQAEEVLIQLMQSIENRIGFGGYDVKSVERWCREARTYLELGLIYLRYRIGKPGHDDKRWLALGRTNIEAGLMFAEQAIVSPSRGIGIRR